MTRWKRWRAGRPGGCVLCVRPAEPGRARCAYHLGYAAAEARRRRALCRLLGRCQACGRSSGGRSRCPRCRGEGTP